MRILKDGKRNSGAFKFKCSKCGCKFEADVNDYIYVKEASADPSESNEPTNRIKCEYPNCKETLFKELYKHSDKHSDKIVRIVLIIFFIVHIIIGMVLFGFGIALKSVPVTIIGLLLAIEITGIGIQAYEDC